MTTRELKRIARYMRKQRIVPIGMYILRHGNHDILFSAQEDIWTKDLLVARIARKAERIQLLRSVAEAQ
jgi:hypothetical protein